MMGHKICFHEEIWIIIRYLSLLLLLIWSTDVYGMNTTKVYNASKGLIGLHARIQYAFEQGYGMQHTRRGIIICLSGA